MPNDPIQDILDEADEEMEESVSYLQSQLRTLRAGRASPAMLENVTVDYYGSQTPLEQVASVSAPQPDLLVVQPFDRNAMEDIERGIMKADLGLNPNNDGEKIRIPVPPPSEERREELVETSRERAEEAKISIRNTRRDAKNEIERVVEEENFSEDVYYGAEEDLQELTDEHTGQVEGLLEQKKDQIMDV
ncbi:MAG: ribosome recycling factor [Bacteroidetes bacterium SW_7_64_58]|jgi:ribosome recycling factor|nr:MAG: ribosome recycling factor [Bacteroidetes bacterium QH_2_64_74]PSQ74662.1 MAG: ribosome recycling factor [Bacteroidetes bacterium QH_7_64_110]PSR00329.1 MAG: ribosome recycling factor [Bacteroidetes bacterium SW_7_64_58]